MSNSTKAPEERVSPLQEQTCTALDFPTVKAFFAQRAQTEWGKRLILEADLMDQASHSNHFGELDQWFQRVHEGLVLRFPHLPGAVFFDRDPATKPFARGELRQVRDVLLFWNQLLEDEQFGFNHAAGDGDPELSEVTKELAGLFDRDGDWREDVSPAYSRLIRQFFQVEEQLQQNLKNLLRRYAEYLNEPIIFERNHRRVLAVKISFRGRVRGILHDYSSSGNTIYIEPDETVGKQNKLTEIESEIKEELWRIRVEMTRRVLDHAAICNTICPSLAHFDRMQGLALVARETQGVCLCPNLDRRLVLFNARHPFLDEAFASYRSRHRDDLEDDHNRMVPFNLHLDGELYGLVISGANTGGKTVTLKTAGLLSWLANSGFPVPVDEGSHIPYYQCILADIGDNQSLSHNLSTFASHLANIREVLAVRDAHTLVLLDELGSGTDPNEGNALAQALIEAICDQGFHLLITTHQQILCTLAMSHPNLDNGSMAFDAKRLKPIYRFNQGVPGRSHALEIAIDAGLPKPLLTRARQLIDDEQVDIQAAIRTLQKQHKELQKQKQKLRRDELRLHHRSKQCREELEALQREREAEKEKSRERVGRTVEKAERELRSLLAGVSSQKQKRAGLAKLANKRKELMAPFGEKEDREITLPDASGLPPGDWQPGDRVFLKNFRREGVLLHLDRKRARVDYAGKKLTVDSHELVHLGASKDTEKRALVDDVAGGGDVPSFELPLLGFCVEDALQELDRTLDRALCCGLPFLRVIHGHGSGALKQAIREYLGHHVARAGFTVVLDRENDGITEVKFD